MWLTIFLEGKLWLTKLYFAYLRICTNLCTLKWHLVRLGGTLSNGEANLWLTIFHECKMWLTKFIFHIFPYLYLLKYPQVAPG